ncbi:MAG: hypothetical protein KDD22_03270 [Bdellovibrionales bacterium]|nr:hypothetical protein [Bdellovibrionales bacterium]
MKRNSLFLIISLLMPSLAWSYIPDYHMILSRVAENHGRGAYVIDQEVILPGENAPLHIKEQWIIKDEYSMAVLLEGQGPLKNLVNGQIVYDQNNKYFTFGSGVQRITLNSDWWMPFFHFRFSKNIKSKIVALKMAPASSLQERKFTGTPQSPAYSNQEFLRLSRTGGVVNYAIGAPTPADSSKSFSGLWIEQDQFVVRKIRLPSQALVVADDYSRYSRQQSLPKEIKVNWDNSQAQILVTQVKSISNTDPRMKMLSAKSLTSSKNIALKMPEVPILREFYQRFR